MSWLTVAWSMGAAACSTLALMYLAIWFQQPRQRAYLLFSVTALGAAGTAVLELLMMRAQTVATYAAALRWSHLPIFVLVVSVTPWLRLTGDLQIIRPGSHSRDTAIFAGLRAQIMF